ncbi:hypothetical protein H9P43_008645 [Blastocladiella emersonii ATCC 22665]|nr:hypothetical protein H9P43_008645 [Blastocladiella emersonii ATCC 22665]
MNAGKEFWDSKWQASNTPWDHGTPAPALVALLAAGRIPTGRVLVPGCGGGYDVLALASADRVAYGVDISPTAVAACLEKHAGSIPPTARFVCADFFAFTEHDLDASQPADAVPQFDAMYDYTFLCALPPSLRGAWAARVAQVVRPGGTLVTLMYPLVDKDQDDGPPYPQSVDGYRALLLDNFEEVEVRECESFESRAGKEKIGVWKRK